MNAWDRLLTQMRAVEGWQVDVATDGTVTITFSVAVLDGNVTATYTPDQLEDARAFYEGYTSK